MRSINCAFMCAICLPAAAIPYTGNGPNSSTISATGPADYVSLESALGHIQSSPAPLTGGDWTFRIQSDLTETQNIEFGKLNTGGHRIIIKPDTATSATIKFTSLSGRAHLAIGTTSDVEDTVGYVKTDNFVIDGSNNGTNSRNLTLMTDPALNAAKTVIQVVGNSDGVQIKNCSVFTNTTVEPGGSAPYPAIQFASYYHVHSGLVNEYPDNGLVDNNDIVIGAFKFACGIAATQRNFAGVFLPAGQTGIVIRNNIITATRSGIELNSTSGADIYANTIRVNQLNDISDGAAVGILAGRGGTTSTAVNIYNNRILQVHAKRGFVPITGIAVGNHSTGFSYNIYNNMICNVAQPHLNFELMCGIMVAGTSTTAVSANIYHNSVHIPAPSSERMFGSAYQVSGVFIPDGPGYPRTSNVNIRNNIFCLEETTGTMIQKDAAGALTSDHNTLYLRTGSVANLQAWQAQSGQDANSTFANPRLANPPATGHWVSTNDLHFTADPGNAFRGTGVAAVSTDIDGEARSSTAPVKGIDEVAPLTAVEHWTDY